MLSTILTVSQVNTFLKSLIESDGRLQDFFISGEISNFTSHYKSGHLYFSLKDDKSVLKAVMFSQSARQLKFFPENGMKIIARGRVSIYEPSGQYQLYVQDLQPDGIGALSLAFEQLKTRLQNEGLFDDSHKKPIPQYPQTIAVVTSPTGAAVRDIMQITARRWPLANILLCPVLVQGDYAAEQILNTLKKVNADSGADVIILGRGGGSLEDLWAFNDEALCREVYASQIPIISAVGHETDFTICDFAADLRAPTPSAAAELCTPDCMEEMGRIKSLQDNLVRRFQHQIELDRQRLDFIVEDSALRDSSKIILRQKDMVGGLISKIQHISQEKMSEKTHKYVLLNEKLDALSPLRILSSGFSLCYNSKNEIIKTTNQVSSGDFIKINVSDGSFHAVVEGVDKDND